MQDMFNEASNFNQCLSSWAYKTPDNVRTGDVLTNTNCPNGVDTPDATVGPWCKGVDEQCVAMYG
jgi:hypothetical protein